MTSLRSLVRVPSLVLALLVLLIQANLLLASPCKAEESAVVVSTAREVAKQGLLAYDQGRYEEALTKLSQAYGAVPLPTLALYSARAANNLGQLVKAAELYLAAYSLAPEPSWQSGQHEAQADAKAERTALLPQIPRLLIEVAGATGRVDVRIDDVLIPHSLIGAEQLLDPGVHVIVAKSGQRERSEQVHLNEGETARVRLEFPHTPATTLAPPIPSRPEDDGAHPGKLQRTLGWVTVGVGGAALLTGVGLGIYVAWKHGRLIKDGNCDSDGHCFDDHAGPVSRYNTLRTMSTVGIVAGSVLAASGVALVLTAPKAKSQLALSPAPGGVLFSGNF